MTVGAKTEEDQKRRAMFKKKEGSKDESTQTENTEVQVDEEEVEEEGNVADSEDGPVHEGFFCNGCQMQPIVGARYKCLECDFSPVLGTFLH